MYRLLKLNFMIVINQVNKLFFMFFIQEYKPGVGFMVKGAGLRSLGLEFEPLLGCWITPGRGDSACHPSEVSKMSTSLLLTGGTASAALPHFQEMMQPAATGYIRNNNNNSSK